MSKKKKKTPAKTTAHTRRITLYLPSKNDVERWNKEANKNGLTTSRFIQNIVNNYFQSGNVLKSQKILEKKLLESNNVVKQLRGENIRLSKQVNMLNILTDRYEEEIKHLKQKDFLDDSFNGIRKYERELITLLKRKRNIKEHELLDLLQVSPQDFATIKAINKQIETLLDYGIIKMYKGGYQWLK
jgi:hypothetical protein